MKRAYSAIAIWSAVAAATVMPAAASAQLAIGITISTHRPPPPLPVYDQPPIPGPDYIWTPGHWRWSNYQQDYYWVPGVWALAPEPGLLWTPPWWGWSGGSYVFHEGYWAPHVGFYGGVSYGHGYTGAGYEGGFWDRGHFAYNRTVNNIHDTRITNVYNKTVVVNRVTNVSFNGPGGVAAQPTPEELRAVRDRHFDATPQQISHRDNAAKDRQLFAGANHGHPAPAEIQRVAVAPAGGAAPDRHDHGDAADARNSAAGPDAHPRGAANAGEAPAAVGDQAPGGRHGRHGEPQAPAAAPDAVAPGKHHGHENGDVAAPADTQRLETGRHGNDQAAPPEQDGAPGAGGKHHGHHGDTAAMPDEGGAAPDKHHKDKGPDAGPPGGKHHDRGDASPDQEGKKKHKHDGD